MVYIEAVAEPKNLNSGGIITQIFLGGRVGVIDYMVS